MIISGTFSAAGVSDAMPLKSGEQLDYALTNGGTFAEKVVLESTENGGLTWTVVVDNILDTVATTRLKNYNTKLELYRFRCIQVGGAFTGTMDYSLISVEDSQTLYADGAISISDAATKLELTAAGAVTLAAPDDSMYGKIKTIEMTVDNGDVTLALTNVVGGTAATTATFSAVGQNLVILGSTGAWIVIKEYGVVLS